MKIFFCLLFLIAASLSQSTDQDNVLIFSESDFHTAVQTENYLLVLFYTPEKLNKSSLSIEYSQVAQFVNETYPRIKVCKVDITNSQELPTTYNVTDELALKLFVKQATSPIDYTKEEDTNQIISWLNEEIDKSVTHVHSVEEAEEWIGKNYLVGLYLGSDPEKQLQFLGYVTSCTENIVFLKSHEGAVNQKFGGSEDAFILFRDYGEESNSLTEDFSLESFQKFVKVYKDPIVLSWDESTRYALNSGSFDAVIFMRNENTPEEEEKFNAVAQQYRGNISFIAMGPEEMFADFILQIFEYDKEALPAVGIYRGTDHKRIFRLNQNYTEKNMRIFLANYFLDNLAGHTRSAKIPNQTYDGNVMVVVGATYNTIVLDESRDVLIEWYSPYCGHCTHFAPTYASLATILKDVPDLVIAKIDATVNHVDGVEIFGYPTLKFYPRGQKKEPIDYQGMRTEQDLINFLKEHGTVEFDLWDAAPA